jgi:DNA-binding HxlR family transcriptional regulator
MQRDEHRSDCPVNHAVEVFGDSWSLIILRDMMTVGSNTFGAFLDTDERIGTSVLAQRLAELERHGVIAKAPDPVDGRRSRYSLTASGRAALPLVYELNLWGTRTNPNTDTAEAILEALDLPRETVIGAWTRALEAGDSFFLGEKSVVRQLALGDHTHSDSA